MKRASLAPVSQADHCSIDLASVALHFDQCCSAEQCCFDRPAEQLNVVSSTFQNSFALYYPGTAHKQGLQRDTALVLF